MISAAFIGMVVFIHWPGLEFHNCTGKLKAVEERMALVTDVMCYNGTTYEYIAGVPIERLTLTPPNNRN